MKDKYEKLRKKHGLPSLGEMDAAFEVGSIEKDANVLREIAKRIYDKVDSYTQVFESLIHPDSRFSVMLEASLITPKERPVLNQLYNKGMRITREALELGVDYNEEKAVRLIKNSYKEWNSMKPEMISIIGKMKKAWSEQVKIEEDRGYFG